MSKVFLAASLPSSEKANTKAASPTPPPPLTVNSYSTSAVLSSARNFCQGKPDPNTRTCVGSPSVVTTQVPCSSFAETRISVSRCGGCFVNKSFATAGKTSLCRHVTRFSSTPSLIIRTSIMADLQKAGTGTERATGAKGIKKVFSTRMCPPENIVDWASGVNTVPVGSTNAPSASRVIVQSPT